MLSLRSNLVNRLIILFPILSLRGANDVVLSSEDVQKKFEEAGIVSELITVAPKHPMEVLYKNNTVKFGNDFKRGDFDTMPTNLQWPTEKNRYYTLILTDPDCPKRSMPIDKEWQHWLVVNIPGCDFLRGEELSAYIGGLPYYLIHPHRYVFLAYLQPDPTPIKFDEPRLDHRPIEIERNHFSTSEFTEKYNLGVPIAGNFFMAGGPEPTPTLPWILRRLLTTDGKQPRCNSTTPRTI